MQLNLSAVSLLTAVLIGGCAADEGPAGQEGSTGQEASTGQEPSTGPGTEGGDDESSSGSTITSDSETTGEAFGPGLFSCDQTLSCETLETGLDDVSPKSARACAGALIGNNEPGLLVQTEDGGGAWFEGETMIVLQGSDKALALERQKYCGDFPGDEDDACDHNEEPWRYGELEICDIVGYDVVVEGCAVDRQPQSCIDNPGGLSCDCAWDAKVVGRLGDCVPYEEVFDCEELEQLLEG